MKAVSENIRAYRLPGRLQFEKAAALSTPPLNFSARWALREGPFLFLMALRLLLGPWGAYETAFSFHPRRRVPARGRGAAQGPVLFYSGEIRGLSPPERVTL